MHRPGHTDIWLRVTVRVTPEAAEAAGELLRTAGCAGWETPAPDTVVGYLPPDERAADRIVDLWSSVHHLDTAGLDPGPGTVLVEVVPSQPWEDAWKEYFKPARIGRIVVAPTSESVDLGLGDVVVRIDPGMAFGSGAHATTRLCLRALQEELPAGGRVLDLGTGSGILAIAAAHLGASEVLAVDNDPEVIPIAEENVALNGVSDRVVLREGDVDLVPETGWDVVLANIAPDPVISAASRVRELIAPGGIYIGAGIPAERAAEVETGVAGAGFRIARVLREGEWVAVVAQATDDTGA